MAVLNKVQLIGRLGQDPEMHYTNNGKTVTKFTVAVNRHWLNANGEAREVTEWFNVEAWNGLAETCNQHLTQGRLVYVEGSLQTDRYEDETGMTRTYTKVVAKNVQFLDAVPADES